MRYVTKRQTVARDRDTPPNDNSFDCDGTRRETLPRHVGFPGKARKYLRTGLLDDPGGEASSGARTHPRAIERPALGVTVSLVPLPTRLIELAIARAADASRVLLVLRFPARAASEASQPYAQRATRYALRPKGASYALRATRYALRAQRALRAATEGSPQLARRRSSGSPGSSFSSP